MDGAPAGTPIVIAASAPPAIHAAIGAIIRTLPFHAPRSTHFFFTGGGKFLRIFFDGGSDVLVPLVRLCLDIDLLDAHASPHHSLLGRVGHIDDQRADGDLVDAHISGAEASRPSHSR